MKTTIILAFFLWCSQWVQAQSTILWEIKHADLATSSYLMGTLKFIGEKEYFLPAKTIEKIKTCQILAIEDEVDHHAQHELNKALHFHSGKSLKTVLTPEEYESLVTFFGKEFEIDPATFSNRYDKLIPLSLSIAMTRLSLGENVRYYDLELLKIAKENKLKTYSLEPIEREAEAIAKYPMDDQVKALMHSVSNFENQKREFQLLMRDYVKGDLEKVFEYNLHLVEENPVFVEEFYVKRNNEWMPKIEKMMRDQSSFIAIGVGHLEGDHGILNLLKEKGYTLTPVQIN